MINKIKEYLNYRRNKRIAKREFVNIAATILPTINILSNKSADIIKFIVNLTNEAKNIKGERLVEMVLNEISVVLQTDNNRLIQILTYIASLQPQDIQKILLHSTIETMSNSSPEYIFRKCK